jgi:hypothetical protein
VAVRDLLAGAAVALLLGTAACSSGSGPVAVPAGSQLIEHPLVEVAVPGTWTPRSTDLPDPDAVQLQVPDVDEEIQVGAAVYQRGERSRSAEHVALATMESLLVAAQGREQTDRREVTVDGAEDAFLLQAHAPSTLFDQPVRFTVIAARTGDGRAVVVRLLGTEEHIPDEVIGTVLDTMRVTG